MKYRLPAFLVCSAFFFSTVPAFAQHGGFGGHGGGGFSGHSMGHFGRSPSGHVSSSHSGGRGHSGSRTHFAHGGQPPPAGAAMIHGRIVQLPTPGFHTPQPGRFRRPVTEFGFGNRSVFFGSGAFSALGFCGPFDGFPSRFLGGGGFDCFDDGFFDPFFFGGFFPGAFAADDSGSSAEPAEPDSIEAQVGFQDGTSENLNYQTTVLNDPPPSAPKAAKAKSTILLQLTDGSMYGLTDYWIVDDRLRYVTDYGGENSVPISRIDFAKTNQLNADRGVKFYAEPQSTKK